MKDMLFLDLLNIKLNVMTMLRLILGAHRGTGPLHGHP